MALNTIFILATFFVIAPLKVSAVALQEIPEKLDEISHKLKTTKMTSDDLKKETRKRGFWSQRRIQSGWRR